MTERRYTGSFGPVDVNVSVSGLSDDVHGLVRDYLESRPNAIYRGMLGALEGTTMRLEQSSSSYNRTFGSVDVNVSVSGFDPQVYSSVLDYLREIPDKIYYGMLDIFYNNSQAKKMVGQGDESDRISINRGNCT